MSSGASGSGRFAGVPAIRQCALQRVSGCLLTGPRPKAPDLDFAAPHDRGGLAAA